MTEKDPSIKIFELITLAKLFELCKTGLDAPLPTSHPIKPITNKVNTHEKHSSQTEGFCVWQIYTEDLKGYKVEKSEKNNFSFLTLRVRESE